MRDQQIDVQMHMPAGIPFEEICKAAGEMPKVLIVMGTHGASGVKEFIMGTTAYSVIKNTTKPVLTIPFSFASTEFKNILFPVRPVQGIKAKYEFIRSFFQNRDVSVHIAALCFPGEQEDLLENKNDIFEIITTLKSTNISCSKELYECKNFATKVLELSNSMNIDLIAINATIDFKWTQLLAGSYTQQVVNHSKVPVLSFNNGIYEPGQSSKITQLEPGINPVTIDRH